MWALYAIFLGVSAVLYSATRDRDYEDNVEV